MDIPRPQVAGKRLRRRILYAAGLLTVVTLIGVGLSRLKPAAPSVERATVWTDTVKRGSMLRQVRGLGTLVPEEIRWIAALSEGGVEKILVLPGTTVKADTLLLVLSNPQVQQEALDAEWKLRAIEADYHRLKVELDSAMLSQKADLAKTQAEYELAKTQADVDFKLSKLGAIADFTFNLSRTKAQQLGIQIEADQQRLKNSQKVLAAQLVAKQAEVEQFRAVAQLKQSRFEDLRVHAGASGVLQEQLLKVGQWVTPGTTLAKVVRPERLKAELKVAETQAKDIQLGLPASVDTHNGVISGQVIRIDPSVQNGTVTVDVGLNGSLPQGARPDLSVDGTVDLERVTGVLYVGRPAFGQEKSTVGMFKLGRDGKTATRARVQLGRTSVNTIEVLQGLKEGEQVILSDMSRWDSFDRIRLE